jgi:hypothetical protein
MSESPIPLPERESVAKHRHQFSRQIILPMVLAVVVIIAVAVLVGIATFSWSGDVARWAEISTIWMVVPLMFFGIIMLALFAGLVYGLGYLLKIAPRYTGIAQNWLLWLNYKIQLITDQIIEPVLQLKAWTGVFSKEEKKK